MKRPFDSSSALPCNHGSFRFFGTVGMVVGCQTHFVLLRSEVSGDKDS